MAINIIFQANNKKQKLKTRSYTKIVILFINLYIIKIFNISKYIKVE